MDVGMIISIIAISLCSLYIFAFTITLIINQNNTALKIQECWEEAVAWENSHYVESDDSEAERLFNSAMFLEQDD